MTNLFCRVKASCTLLVIGMELTAFATTLNIASVATQQRYPCNGLVDILVTFNGEASDVVKVACTFTATNSATQTALPIVHITRLGEDFGSGNVWMRRFLWDTNADLGAVKIDDVELVVDVDVAGGVQLWDGGPYWAECNVGAAKPDEAGYYFWWGDTVGYKRVENVWTAADGSQSKFSFDSKNCPTSVMSRERLLSSGYIDSTDNLVAAHDAATAHLGTPWRMPTKSECDDLMCNCDTQWVMHNDVFGRLIKGRGAYASRCVFFPAAGIGYHSGLSVAKSCGYYWSATIDGSYGYQLGLNSDRIGPEYNARLYAGASVRPVRGFVSSVHLTHLSHLEVDNRPGVTVFATTPIVTSVSAQQRYPWNGLVDIIVTIDGVASDVAKANCTFCATNSAMQTALPVVHVTRMGADSGSAKVWTRRFLWDSNADVGEVKIDDVELIVEIESVVESPNGSGGVQLWEGGPHWAECNVGAVKPEESGCYFWWGDTVGHKPIGNQFGGNWYSPEICSTYNKTAAELQSLGYIDSTCNLTAAHDAATAHLGANWRMPTDAEFSDILNYCITIWTTCNGVYGRLVAGTGAFSSKSIFLPAAGIATGSSGGSSSSGFYRSSTIDLDDSTNAWFLYFGSGYFGRGGGDSRHWGLPVRPVRGFDK